VAVYSNIVLSFSRSLYFSPIFLSVSRLLTAVDVTRERVAAVQTSLTMSRRGGGKGRCANEKRGIIWNRTAAAKPFALYTGTLFIYCALCECGSGHDCVSFHADTHKYALYLQVKGSAAATADDALLPEDKHEDKHSLISSSSTRHKNSFLSMDQSPVFCVTIPCHKK